MPVTAVIKEQVYNAAHSSNVIAISCCSQRTQLVPASFRPLAVFGPSGGFLWSVFVNTQRDELWAAVLPPRGMPGEAALCVLARAGEGQKKKRQLFDKHPDHWMDVPLFMKM